MVGGVPKFVPDITETFSSSKLEGRLSETRGLRI
jgi:hypothetical protein